MTDSYKIRYLGTAEKDLIEIFEYIRRDNPSFAESQLDRFDSAIAHLTTHPFLGVIPKDDRLKRLGYRMLVVDRYLIFYVVKNNTVQIRRIIHGARQYSFLL